MGIPEQMEEVNILFKFFSPLVKVGGGGGGGLCAYQLFLSLYLQGSLLDSS